jgi:spore maturation protein CgeB
MKILIGNDGYSAHYYIRMGLGKAFTAAGHEVIMWQMDQKPVNDAFDEFEPDIFISQTYNLKPSIVRAIKERPHMKVICKAGDWGRMAEKIDPQKYPVLFASEEEKETVIKLREECGKPNYVYIHYHPDWVEETHGYWASNGVPVHAQLSAADIIEYTNGQRVEEFISDIVFIGGYWPYKAQVLDPYLIPLCDGRYNVKIFGNSNWPVPNYCGMIADPLVKHAFASATICPNLGEPHSIDFGYDVIERPYKLAANRCFIISDNVEGLRRLYPEDEIVYAKNPQEFHGLIDNYLKHPEERRPYIDKAFIRTIREHTYFDRVKEIFTRLGFSDEANHVDVAKQNIIEAMGIK